MVVDTVREMPRARTIALALPGGSGSARAGTSTYG
jgi:hypothetical protein